MKKTLIFYGIFKCNKIAFWTRPEGIRCQQAERLWLNLAISEMPVSGQVVIRLIKILDRAYEGARNKGYVNRYTPFDWVENTHVKINTRAQYVLVARYDGPDVYALGVCQV